MPPMLECSKKGLDIFKAANLGGFKISYVSLFSDCKISVNHKQLITGAKVVIDPRFAKLICLL